MCKQNDEQMIILTKVTLGEHETKSLHLCQITTWHTTCTQVYISQTVETKNIHQLWSVSSLSVSTYLAIYQYRKRNIRCSFNFNFDGLRLSGIERSNYTESNNLGRKSWPVSGIERIRYSGCYISRNIREKIGTNEIVRFHGDSGIERIRFRGFYCTL